VGEPPRVFRVLLFDLDDTLFDRGAAFGRWARARLGEAALDADTMTSSASPTTGSRHVTPTTIDGGAFATAAADAYASSSSFAFAMRRAEPRPRLTGAFKRWSVVSM
jgi:hypothetical protein